MDHKMYQPDRLHELELQMWVWIIIWTVVNKVIFNNVYKIQLISCFSLIYNIYPEEY